MPSKYNRKQNQPLHLFHGKHDRKVVADMRKKIAKGLGVSIGQYKKNHSEEQLFHEALKHVTTSKKAVCYALKIIGIDNACRIKRRQEIKGVLWVVKKAKCPITNKLVDFLSTDPTQAPNLPNQLQLF